MQLSSARSSGSSSQAFHLGLRVARLVLCVIAQPEDCTAWGQVTPTEGAALSTLKIPAFVPVNARTVTGVPWWSCWWVGGHCRVCFPTSRAQPADSWEDACSGPPVSPSSGEKAPDDQGCQHRCALARCCLPDPKDYLGLNPGAACCCQLESRPGWLRGRSGFLRHLRGLHIVCRHRCVAPEPSGSQLFPLQIPFSLGRWCYK